MSAPATADRRTQHFQRLFACTFSPPQFEQCLTSTPPNSFFGQLLRKLTALDAELAAVATERPLSEINRVDLAILRLILFESRHLQTAPKILVNEAVELAKRFGTEASPKFVNGVLAKILID